MDLVKLEKQKRIKGVVVGAILPLILLMIVGVYGYFGDRPYMMIEGGFIVAPNTYLGVLTLYVKSISHYHAFFCLTGNMALVWLLTNKKKNSMANGVIAPTAIYALILVALRLI